VGASPASRGRGASNGKMAGTCPAKSVGRCVSAKGAPDVVPIVHKAIEVVAEADAGVGVPDHELIAEVHRVLSGGLGITRLHGGRGGRAEQYE
jgi:hypothetical protein